MAYFEKKMEVEKGIWDRISGQLDIPKTGMGIPRMGMPRFDGVSPVSRHTQQWR
jgi:hypothetical protein